MGDYDSNPERPPTDDKEITKMVLQKFNNDDDDGDINDQP